MPRKGEVPKRKLLPDPKFTDQTPDMRRRITKFRQTVMSSGKNPSLRGSCTGVRSGGREAGDDPVKVWDKAMANVQPKIEVKSPTRGVARPTKFQSMCAGPGLGLGIAGSSTRARAIRRTHHAEKLAAELLDASANKGPGQEARRYTHKMAEAKSVCPLPL